MHAALNESQIVPGQFQVVRMIDAPAQKVIHRVGECIGRRVGTGLEVEADLAEQNIGGEIQTVVVAEQCGEHVLRQLVLVNHACVETVD